MLDKGEVWPNASQETTPRMNLTEVTNISSDKPISVNQFSTSIPCDPPTVPVTDLGDPFLISLSPNEQLLRGITFSAFDAFPTSTFFYYTDIISPTNGVSGVKFDGADISGDFIPVPDNPDFSYAQLANIGNGNHSITSDSGFIAYVYGYGEGDATTDPNNPTGSPYESFGYATGASLENLNIPLFAVDSGQVVVGVTDTLCLGNEIVFFPEIDTAIYKFFSWKMGDGAVYDTKDVTHIYTDAGEYLVEFTASILPSRCGDTDSNISGTKVFRVIKPTFSRLDFLTVCPNTDSILYVIRNPGDFNVGDYKWTVGGRFGGGTIITDPMNDSILVNWGPADSTAYLLIESSNTYGCVNTDSITIRINNRLTPKVETLMGADSVCFSDLSQTYETPYANNNFYQWFADGGTVMPDTNSLGEHIVNILWDPNESTHRLWYMESSLIDSACSGISDTLSVWIGNEIQGTFSNQQNPTCNDGTDGQLQFTPSGGVGGIVSSVWSHDSGLTNLFPQNLPARDYTVTVTDGTGCSVDFTESLSQPDTFVINTVATDTVCFGANDGEISVEVLSGGAQPYTFGWIGLNSSASFTSTATTTKAVGLGGGDYQFTIQYNSICTYTSDVIAIQERDQVTFSIAGEVNPCNFISRGYKASNPDLNYTWNVGGGTIMANLGDSIYVTWGNATAGAFVEARGEDANGCFTNLTRRNVTIFELNPIAPVGRTQICFNELDSIQYSLTPNPIYNYQWFVQGGTIIGSNVGSSIYVKWNAGTPPSRFVYYIQESNSDAICNFTSDTLFIADDLVELSATFNMDSANCFGEASGELTVLPTGDAVGNYSYNWAHNGSISSNVATNLEAGIYTVQITDALGCSIIDSAEVLQPDSLISQITSSIDTTCFGEGQGRIEVDVLSGGTPNYEFSWIGTSNFSSTPTKTIAENLPKGFYRYEIKDNNGLCTFISEPIEIIERPLITFNISGDDLACNGVNKIYKADVEEFAYKWLVEGGTIVGDSTLDEVEILWGVANASARVRAVAIDQFGCSSDTTNFGVEVFELEPLAPVGRTQICFNELNGITYTLPAPADPEYRYEWEVIGGNIIGSNEGDNISVNWIASSTGRRIFYKQISRTDETVCQFTSEILEIQDALVTLSASLGTDPVKCFGESTGSIFVESVSVAGLSGMDYSLNWQHDSSIPSTQDTVRNLPVGTYAVIISVTTADLLTCSITESETITQPTELQLVLDDKKDLSCFEASNGQANGEVNVSTSGGIAPYSYVLFDGTDTVDVDNSTDTLVVGTYLIEVTDANGCQKFIDNIEIGQPDEPIFGIVGPDSVCSGVEFPYSAKAGYNDYIWSVNDGSVITNNANPGVITFGQSADTFKLDLQILINTARATCLHDTTAFIFSNFDIASVIAEEPNCADSTNGSIEVVMNNQNNNYNYEWTSFTSDSSKLVGIGAGRYFITISSDVLVSPSIGIKTCVIKRDTVLTEPTKVGIRKPINIVAALCNGDENASFNVAGTGGTPDYTYLWENSDGDTIRNSNVATGLLAGNYKAIILDANLCEFDTLLFVSQPDSLKADANSEFTPTYCQANTGSVTLNPSGGTMPYTFLFDSGSADGNTNINLPPGGPWRAIVTDRNGCKDTIFYEIKLEVPEVELAEAFTPNEDGTNDFFGPVFTCPDPIIGSGNLAPTVAFKIYDRFGNLVYASSDTNNASWDGKVEEKRNAPSGRYNYFLDYRITLDGIPYHITKEGSVLLLR